MELKLSYWFIILNYPSLLIVLNGIETKNLPTEPEQQKLLIVLNGIETYHTLRCLFPFSFF